MVAACSSPKVEVAKACPPEDSADYYFPPGSLIPTNRDLDLVQRQALSRRLEAAREPPLWCGEPRDGYRVVNVGGHSRETQLVSLRRTASGWQGTRVYFASPLQSKGQNNVYFRWSNPIPPPLNTSDINFAMAEADFWSGDVWQDVESEGAIVFIEARINEDYRAVTRAAPSEAFLRIAQVIRDKLPPMMY
jgi:hypothetical protein